jgi:hypothetical protein
VKLFLTVVILTIASTALAQEALLPNPKLTPGRIAERDKDRGGVTLKMEQKVFARYRLAWARRAEFKIDNLWPQSLRAKPYGADRKELLTEVLLERIRAGRITIAQAQEQIRNDWIDAFVDHLGMVYLK